MTKGLSAKWLFSWTARAATLLPVPLSPKINIDAGVFAARINMSITSRMRGVVKSKIGSRLCALVSVTSCSSRSMRRLIW